MTLSNETEARSAARDKARRALQHLDLTSGRGLELGALDRPLVRRSGADVGYVDLTDTEGLRAHYADDPNVRGEDLVEVDFTLLHDGQTRTLAEATNGSGTYAWVVASHVIEHVPDLIGFLADVAEVLVDGGRLALVVPDSRYSFDALRQPTTVGEILLAHHQGDQRPSLRAVFDHFTDAVNLTAAALWEGAQPTADDHLHSPEMAWDNAFRWQAGEYIDCHAWLFTPTILVDQLRQLADQGLSDFTVAAISPTKTYEAEFFATLQRVPRDLGDRARVDLLALGFHPIVDSPDPPATAQPDGEYQIVVSEREMKVIEAKRRLGNFLRQRVPRR